jgi:hypothetical protein
VAVPQRNPQQNVFRSSTGRRSAANLRALELGALLAHEVHTEKRGVAHVHARSGHQIAQHAAPRALAVDGAVALQPAAVLNQRVTQEDSFRECSVAQRRQLAVGGGEFKGASAGGACVRRNYRREIREGALSDREKGLGRDILANCERKGVGSCRQRLRAAAFCIRTGLSVLAAAAAAAASSHSSSTAIGGVTSVPIANRKSVVWCSHHWPINAHHSAAMRAVATRYPCRWFSMTEHDMQLACCRL